MIEIKNVKKVYKNGKIEIPILQDINLKIADKEIISIVGKSGSGKSTLLNLISGNDYPTSGEIYYKKQDITKVKRGKLAKIRLNNFGFVYQKFYLISTLSVKDNIILTAQIRDRNYDKDLFKKVVSHFEIEGRLKYFPNQLSGGEQQRVAIARAIMGKPRVIFADEPTGNLDSINSKNVMGLLFDFIKKNKSTLIYVTHDEELAREASRYIEIKDGRIFE